MSSACSVVVKVRSMKKVKKIKKVSLTYIHNLDTTSYHEACREEVAIEALVALHTLQSFNTDIISITSSCSSSCSSIASS